MHSGALAMLRPDLAVPVTVRFALWYYGKRPLRIIDGYVAYAKAFRDILSIPFLLRTLLSPWKNITDPYPKQMLNVRVAVEAFVLNMTSRVAGAVVRSVALLFALVAQVLLLLGAGVYLALWLMFPLIFLAGSGYLLLALFA